MDGRIKWQNEQFIREILRDNRGDDVWKYGQDGLFGQSR
jgi:hypothetical protein